MRTPCIHTTVTLTATPTRPQSAFPLNTAHHFIIIDKEGVIVYEHLLDMLTRCDMLILHNYLSLFDYELV